MKQVGPMTTEEHEDGIGVVYCNESNYRCYWDTKVGARNYHTRGDLCAAVEAASVQEWHVRFTPNYGWGSVGWFCTKEEVPAALDLADTYYRLKGAFE